MIARAVTVLVLPAEVVVPERERIGIELVGLVAGFDVGGEAHRARGQAEQLAVGQRERTVVVARLRGDRWSAPRWSRTPRASAACRDAPGRRRRSARPESSSTPVCGPRNNSLAVRRDDLRPAHLDLVLAVVEIGLVFPVVAERALDAGRDRDRASDRCGSCRVRARPFPRA